jgi:hypothetical protein
MSELTYLCAEMGITVTCNLQGYRPVAPGNDWSHFAWICTLEYKGRKLQTSYRTGVAHCCKPIGAQPQWQFDKTIDGKAVRERWYRNPKAPIAPSVADVVSCLVSDGMSAQSDFEEWCSELGYDSDSRKAYSMYQECQTTLCKLVALFGSDLQRLEGVEH